MSTLRRRVRVHLAYLRRPMISFIPGLIGLNALLFIGGFSFYGLYQHELTFRQALYITFALLFGEPTVEWPEHWFLETLFWVLPPLGLVVALDFIVRFSYHILRRDEASKEWVMAMASTLNNHVILCGLGKVGLRVLQQLVRLGEEVIVLERDEKCSGLSYARKHGIPVLIGTGREEAVFEELNIARAKSIICATDDDLANLEIALDARKYNDNIRVVLRMFDQELAGKIRESFGMHLAFSTSELAAPLFATSSSDRSIVNSFYVGEQLLVVANITINPDSELAGKQIRDLGSKQHVFIISHLRGGETTMFPTGDTTFFAGDEVTLQTKPATLRRIHELNRDPQPY